MPSNGVDGIFGNQTRQAFHEFKELTYQDKLDTIGPSSAKLLLELKFLPNEVEIIKKIQAEGVYGKTITQQQLTDLNQCLARFEINTLLACAISCLKRLTKAAGYNGLRN